MKLNVICSIKTYLANNNIPYNVNYAVESSPFGTMVVVTVHHYLTLLKYLKEEEIKNAAELVNKEFFDALTVNESSKEVRNVIDVQNLSPSFSTTHLKILVKGTKFQESVWHELIKIAPGTLSYYTDVANKIGHPAAARPVGTAVGRNPVIYIIPCHRVIGKNGNVLKFGPGPELKKKMLLSEGK